MVCFSTLSQKIPWIPFSFDSLLLLQIAPEVHFAIQNMINAIVYESCLNQDGIEMINKNEAGSWNPHLFLKVILFID